MNTNSEKTEQSPRRPSLAVITSMPLKEPSSWYGTTDAFVDGLRRHFPTIVRIAYGLPGIAVLPYKVLAKFCYPGSGTGTMPLFWRISECRFRNALRGMDHSPDYILHMSDFSVPVDTCLRSVHMAYQDATLVGLLKAGESGRRLIFSRRSLARHIELSKRYYDRMASIFTFNEWTRQSLVEDYGIDESLVHNIGFGVKVQPLEAQKDYRTGLLLTVVRRGVERIKGVSLLVEAFKRVRLTCPAVRLAVVGTTISPPIDGIDCYEGFPRGKTLQLFAQASLFVMPALFEANGMVYIEALANKTPILGLRRYAFPEFAGNGKYGFIVDTPDPSSVSDMIIEALSDPERLRSMGESGQCFVKERFNWDVVAEVLVRRIKG